MPQLPRLRPLLTWKRETWKRENVRRREHSQTRTNVRKPRKNKLVNSGSFLRGEVGQKTWRSTLQKGWKCTQLLIYNICRWKT